VPVLDLERTPNPLDLVDPGCIIRSRSQKLLHRRPPPGTGRPDPGHCTATADDNERLPARLDRVEKVGKLPCSLGRGHALHKIRLSDPDDLPLMRLGRADDDVNW
jgi:hypothetical protein